MIRPRGRRWRAIVASMALVLAGALAGCGAGDGVAIAPDRSAAADATLSPTLLAARAQVLAALGAARFQVADARTAYRPGESPALADAPRTVVQAVLPAAPDAGYVVIYELGDPDLATATARELAQYLASGPGRVQFPGDASFTIRQVGAALVFHVWSPSVSADPDGERGIATALAGLGQGFDVRG